MAGIFFVYKCAGAAAEEGMNLAQVKEIAQRTAHNVRTMGVALSPCTVPRVSKSAASVYMGIVGRYAISGADREAGAQNHSRYAAGSPIDRPLLQPLQPLSLRTEDLHGEGA